MRQEIPLIYAALKRGEEPVLEYRRPYREYIAWLQRQNLRQAESFWRERLANLTAPTPLGIDGSPEREEHVEGRYDEQLYHFSEKTTTALKLFARQHHITLNTLFQGVWALLLSHYSGEESVLFGATVSGRPAEIPGAETMIGLFINTLPVRVDVAPQENLLPWLTRLQEYLVEIRQFEYCPLTQIHAWSDIHKGQPFFDSILVFENYPTGRAKSDHEDGLWMRNDYFVERTNYPLTICVGQDGKLSIKVIYDVERFTDDAIERLLGHIQTLLAKIVATPESQLVELSPLTASERRKLLDTWNNTQATYPRDRCIHHPFEAQVAQTPDAVALVSNGHKLTYRELNQQANQLAHHLQRLGVKPEMPIGIFVERSQDMVIGILGILKAGGAYVPLDPAYPKTRLAFILTDTMAPVVLTQQHLLSRLPQNNAQTLCLDRDWPLIAQEDACNLAASAKSTNLAYVIYTSGSTGQPKGVAIAHQSVLALLSWSMDIFPPDDLTGVLAATSINFDLSVYELFLPLSCGGTIILVQDALELLTTPPSYPVTLINTVPTIMSELLQAAAIPDTVRTVNLAGEPLTRELVQQVYEQAQVERVYNLYGPSEDTTYSTYMLIDRDDDGKPLIGRPISNTQAYVLDKYLRPVPTGVPGELYLGGAGLARGYLNRPELTRERFIDDPLHPESDARLYKTGDLVRYRSDGNLEFLGRIDHQVKIRGFRIELGEIEAALRMQSGVQDVVVLAREDEAGHKQLVAYIVPVEGQSVAAGELQVGLKQQLPDYMIPSAFVSLTAFPQTPNGKLDRRALPAPDRAFLAMGEEFVSPQSDLEKQLAGIWADVLKVEKIGIHDNFFHLGGDSILSIQVVSKANQSGLYLTPKKLFQHPTIAKLAAIADEKPTIQAEQTPIVGPVALTPIQRWFFAQEYSNPSHWNQAMLLETPDDVNVAHLEQTIQSLTEHHDALRLRFTFHEAEWQQVNSAPIEAVPLIKVDLASQPPLAQRETVATIASQYQSSLCLTEGPLIQAVFFHLGIQQRGRLLLIIHHLAVDGVSWRILLEDLQTAYGQLQAESAIQLPPKTTSYKQWAQQLTEYSQTSSELHQELDYWRTAIPQNVTRLPVDKPRGENSVASGRFVRLSLSAAETRVLIQEIPRAYNTQINDLLLTALVQSFSSWLHSHTLLVALEGHGREALFNDVDLSRTVGWFTSIFPVLLELNDSPDIGVQLTSIKEQLACIPQRGIGYGILRYLRQDDDIAAQLERQAQPEVSFNYLGQFDQTFSEATLFQSANESSGADRSPHGRRPHLLEINGQIIDGCLQMDWGYSAELHDDKTIEQLAQRYMTALRSLIEHCCSVLTPSLARSDVVEERVKDIYPARSDTHPQNGATPPLTSVGTDLAIIDSTLVAIQPSGSKRPFFCIHPLDGTVIQYYGLAHHLGPEQPLYGLQIPNLILNGGEPKLSRNLKEIAAQYIEAISHIQPTGPYLLGGWSFGGMVAFEMAQQLQQAAQQVGLLAVIDIGPSSEPIDDNNAPLLIKIAQEMAQVFAEDLLISLNELRDLPFDEQLRYTLKQLYRAGVVPTEGEREFARLRRIFRINKAHCQALECYFPQSYSGEITFFKAEQTIPNVQSTLQTSDPRLLGWDKISDKPVMLYEIPGDHFSIWDEPHVQVLANHLKNCINRPITSHYLSVV